MAGLSLDAGVDRLSVAQRQRLEIVKALATGATTLLLDEPSAVLAPSEVDELLTLIRDFVGRGGAAAFITHKLREVFIAADRVTVLRRGAVTLSGSVSGETEATLALAMIGKALPESGGDTTRPAVLPAPSEPILAHLGGLPLRGGELIGVAAIEGNGQRKLLRDLAQTDSTAGSVALVPEDRTIEGLIPDLSITENLLLGLDRAPGWSSGRWIDRTRARTRTTQLIEAFGIRADGPDAAVRTLSGGNQQKVVLARALERQPAILIAENPTRGLDIRATSFVQDQLRAAARAGMLVLIYSTDLDEVLELGQRVLVVHGGRVTEAPPGADRQMVGEMMLGLAAKGESGSGER